MRDTPPVDGSASANARSPVHHIVAIVLAAGGSTRMGTPKQLLLYDGEPLVRRAALAAAHAGAGRVLVIIGADSALVAAAVDGMALVETVLNPEWQDGLSSSLSVGVRAAISDRGCDAVLITLADQPLVDSAALSSLVCRFNDDNRIVAAEYEGSLGVPALIGREHLEDLLQITGDSGARRWLRSRCDDVHRVPLSRAALDIDTPSDAKLLTAARR
ncbi:MAG TPA: nucleotidyltransferase family protein [Gemmatimonadaceae bacterium]|nr:nucleotidyltransferase family protein [Gemmatimonadaceae bacterium]